MNKQGEYHTNNRIAGVKEELQAEEPASINTLSTHAPYPDPVSWLVDGWMPDHTLSVLTGAGGAGKSRIALQLAVAVATGRQSFIPPSGRRPPLTPKAPGLAEGSGGVVLFAAWETRVVAWQNRLASIHGPNEGRAERMAGIDGQLHYANMRPHGGLWSAEGWLNGGLGLLRKAEFLKPRLMILDPVAAAYQSNENDRGQVRMFLSFLDEWCENLPCACLIISHPPKSGDPQSGSTDWRNGVQAVWELAAADRDTPGGVRQLRVDKLNEGPLPDPVMVDYEDGKFVEVNAHGKEIHNDV